MSRRRLMLVAAMLGMCLFLASCASSGSSSVSSSGGKAAWADAAAQKDISRIGTFVASPTEAVSPPKSKKLMLVSCGQSITACQFDIAGAAEAASALGWKTTIFDTKGDSTLAATAVRQAIAGHYDGIYQYFIDCDYDRAALAEAKAAHIPVVAAEAFDCSQTSPGAESLFTYVVHYVEGDLVQHSLAWGRSIADYAISKSGGASHALVFADDTQHTNTPIVEGMQREYKRCGGCSLKVVRFPFAAFGSKLQSIAQEELLKNPSVDTVLSTYEAISLNVWPAVRTSGRKILLYVGEGGPSGMDLIRQGVNGYGDGWPLDWEGWASVDALARIFAGQKPVPTGMGVQVFDKAHNTPHSGPYASPVDYKSLYRKLWGLS